LIHTDHGTASERAELDSHADTCIIGGSSMVLLSQTGDTVTVSAALRNTERAKSIPVVTAACAYDHLETGETYVLIFHQSLYMGDKVGSSLLNVNQMRDNGIKVDDCPKQFDDGSCHCIQTSDPEITIPLRMIGVISYFPIRIRTKRTGKRLRCP